jgi:hypothetical protein
MQAVNRRLSMPGFGGAHDDEMVQAFEERMNALRRQLAEAEGVGGGVTDGGVAPEDTISLPAAAAYGGLSLRDEEEALAAEQRANAEGLEGDDRGCGFGSESGDQWDDDDNPDTSTRARLRRVQAHNEQLKLRSVFLFLGRLRRAVADRAAELRAARTVVLHAAASSHRYADASVDLQRQIEELRGLRVQDGRAHEEEMACVLARARARYHTVVRAF